MSDIGLPDVSGWDLMLLLRPAGLRGIALSGFVADGDRRRSLDCGFAHHPTKPVDVAELVEVIRQETAGVSWPPPAEPMGPATIPGP